MNNFEAALAEAAFMTGLERNADIVHQATYAPLFAHVDGWQWRPDLIWFNNLESVRTVNWYVQMLYATNRGTHILNLTEGGKPVEGHEKLYASAAYDKTTKGYIVKIVNAGDKEQRVDITFTNLKRLGKGRLTTLHSSDPRATNTLDNKTRIVPQTTDIEASGNVLHATIPAKTFAVYRF